MEDIEVQKFMEKLDSINQGSLRKGAKLRPNYGLDWIEELKRRLSQPFCGPGSAEGERGPRQEDP